MSVLILATNMVAISGPLNVQETWQADTAANECASQTIDMVKNCASTITRRTKWMHTLAPAMVVTYGILKSSVMQMLSLVVASACSIRVLARRIVSIIMDRMALWPCILVITMVVMIGP